jgi:hypothetical protein
VGFGEHGKPLEFLKIPNCHFTTLGARFDSDITVEEWASAGLTLLQAVNPHSWIMGDWLVYGAARWANHPNKHCADHYRATIDELKRRGHWRLVKRSARVALAFVDWEAVIPIAGQVAKASASP